MGDCSYPQCEGDDHFSYTCEYCSLSFCSEHRVPETHECWGVVETKLGPDFSGVAVGESPPRVDTKQTQKDEHGAEPDELNPENSSPSEEGDDTQSNPDTRNPSEIPGRTESRVSSQKKQCEDCSSFIPSDKELCLQCRRKRKRISSTSPDVKTDGSLETSDTVQNPAVGDDTTVRQRLSQVWLSAKLFVWRSVYRLVYLLLLLGGIAVGVLILVQFGIL